MLRSLDLLVTMPKVADVGLVSTPPQFGWFGKLKASARNWRFCRSVERGSLEQRQVPVLEADVVERDELRFWFGRVPLAGLVAQGWPLTVGSNQ